MYVTVLRASGNVQHFKESFNIDAEYEVSDNISLAVAILIFPVESFHLFYFYFFLLAQLALFLKYHRLTKIEIGPAPPPAPPSSTLLTHLPSLCLSPPPIPADGSCATVHDEFILECPGSDKVVVNQVHFAVKTCSKFHASRCKSI